MTPALRPPSTARAGPRRPSLPLQQAPAHPPPFALPAAHFVASFVWLAVGSAGLVLLARTLADGNYLDPRVFAVVHAFTLGVVTTTIFGALYQMFPPLMGIGLRSVGVAGAGFVLQTLGVFTLLVGLWRGQHTLQATGWTLVAGAIGCVSWNLLPQRRRAPQGRMTGLYILAGHSALGFALMLAGARIGEGLGWWHLDRLGVLSAHFHLAALGFATLTAVGVGSRIVPMFLGTNRVPAWPLRVIGPLAGAGLALLSAGQVAHIRLVTLAGAALLTGGMALYLWMVVGFFRRRTRPIDPALGHIAAAYLALAASVMSGLTLLAVRGPVLQRGAAAYVVVALLGWLVLLILGVYYRVIPFLAWLNLAGPSAARSDPTGLMLRGPAWVSLGALAWGVTILATGIWAGSGSVATAGAASFATGVVVLLGQYVRLGMVIGRSRSGAAKP
jgi:hypothetical protein